MGLFWLINAKEKLGRWEVSEVLHYIWGGVIMVVSTFSMMTETMSVLQPQIKSLEQQRSHLLIFQLCGIELKG